MNSQLAGLFNKEGAAIPLTGVEVRGNITGRATRVKVLQHFRNTESNTLEAIYKFPLPQGSSVCGFRVVTNGKVIVGEIEEREKAFEIYDKALSVGDGGYLLDEERPNIFTLSVGNINPGSETTIELDYVTLLDTYGSEVRFFLPTTISPRYVPPDVADVNGIPVEELVNPPVNLHVDYGLKILLDIHGRKDILTLDSPSHTISTTFCDESIKVELTSEKTAMDKDFILNIKYKDNFETKGYLYRTGKESYAQLDISPVATQEQSSQNNLSGQEIIFVLDCSGSMGGSSIQEAKQALSILLKALEPGTFFNIFRFGSTFEHLFDKSMVYDSKNLETALKYLSGIDADLGGTEILAPLQAIQRKLTPEKISKIVLLTDGEVGNEEQILDLIRGNKSRMQIFAVGIGNGPNEYFIKQLARLSSGASELISPNERIEPRVLRLFRKINSNSSVKDLKIDWGTKVIPATIPTTVYFGETISVFAKLDNGGNELSGITISGRIGDSKREWTISPSIVEGDNIPIPTLWAREKIQEYEEGEAVTTGSRQYKRKDKIVTKEVIELSKQYGIISRATSFIAVEKRQETEKSKGETVLRKVPVMLTDGWGGLKDMHVTSFMGGKGLSFLMRQQPSSPLFDLKSTRSSIYPHEREAALTPEPDNNLLRILSLQQADGGFRIDESFAKVLNKPFSDLQNIADSIQTKGNIDKFLLLSTALIIKYLEREYQDDKDSWEAIILKSRKWFANIIANFKPTIEKLELLEWVDRFFEEINPVK
jgi:Ca-activated chloride channel family protein